PTAMPTTLAFGDQIVGTTATKTLTVTNPDPVNPTGFTVSTGGDYTWTSSLCTTIILGKTCALGPGASGTIEVTFTPSATGDRSYVLALDNPAGHTFVGLTGNGVSQPVPTMPIVTPTSLAFGNQAVGTTSSPQTITITNTDAVNPIQFSVSGSS